GWRGAFREKRAGSGGRKAWGGSCGGFEARGLMNGGWAAFSDFAASALPLPPASAKANPAAHMTARIRCPSTFFIYAPLVSFRLHWRQQPFVWNACATQARKLPL